jgi:hypothetical protein
MVASEEVVASVCEEPPSDGPLVPLLDELPLLLELGPLLEEPTPLLELPPLLLEDPGPEVPPSSSPTGPGPVAAHAANSESANAESPSVERALIMDIRSLFQRPIRQVDRTSREGVAKA